LLKLIEMGSGDFSPSLAARCTTILTLLANGPKTARLEDRFGQGHNFAFPHFYQPGFPTSPRMKDVPNPRIRGLSGPYRLRL